MRRATWSVTIVLLALLAACGISPEDVTPEDLYGAWRADDLTDTVERAYLVFSLSNAFYPELAGKSNVYRAYWTEAGVTTLKETGTFELSEGQLITHLSNGVNTYANDIISLRGDTLALESSATETRERAWTRVDASPLNDELATYQSIETIVAGYVYESYREHAAIVVGGEIVRLEQPTADERTAASAIAVTGGDVYVAGVGTQSDAVYLWRNGELVYPDPGYLPLLPEMNTEVVGLLADGSEVVLIVRYYPQDGPYLLGYYRNGIWTEMTTEQEMYQMYLGSAALVEGKLYVLAWGDDYYRASYVMLWEDDHWATVLPGDRNSANDLAVVGTDVYLTGSTVPAGGNSAVPAMWKNGEALDVPNEGYGLTTGAGEDPFAIELVTVDGALEAYAFGGFNWIWRDGEMSEWTPPAGTGIADAHVTDMAWIGGSYVIWGWIWKFDVDSMASIPEAFTYRFSPDLTTVALVPAFVCPVNFHAQASVTLAANGS